MEVANRMDAPFQDPWLLFLDSAPSLRAYIRRRVSDRAEAEEVFQELSLVVFRHPSSPREKDHFSAWCHGLARHLLAHHFRTKRRRANMLSRFEFESTGAQAVHGVDPERSASARELLGRLGKRLGPQAHELLAQRYLMGESTEEIALRLARSPTAIRMRLMRLRSLAKRDAS
jgi:RNA polymerase sigma factor (sigma-70 family)